MRDLSEVTFRIGVVLLMVVPVGIRMYFHLKSMRPAPISTPIDPERARREGRFLLVRLPVGMAASTLVLPYAINPAWVRSLMVSIPNGWRWFGLAMGTLALVGVYEVHRRIGKFWAPGLEIREGHDLVTTGPYLLVRHPSQAVRSVVAIALSLVSANWLLMLICAINLGLLYHRMERVEAKLIERFGNRYLDYMKRTGCLVPRLRAKA